MAGSGIVRAVFKRGGDTPQQYEQTAETRVEAMRWAQEVLAREKREGWTFVQLWVELWQGGRMVEKKILQKAS